MGKIPASVFWPAEFQSLRSNNDNDNNNNNRQTKHIPRTGE
jgi:hypothetical protein